MDAPASLIIRNSLDAMSAGFLLEQVDVIAFKAEAQGLLGTQAAARTYLSANPIGQAHISLGQFPYEYLGIIAAFASTDLNFGVHGVSPVGKKKPD